MSKSKAIRSRKTYPSGFVGGASSELCHMGALAFEAWGDAAHDPDSSALAFAYLYRRFGPPSLLGDSHKDMAEWVLTTNDPDVLVSVHPGGGEIGYALTYWVRASLEDEARKPAADWWTAYRARIADAVAAERPEFVSKRDDDGEPAELSDEGWAEVDRRYFVEKMPPEVIAIIGRPPRMGNPQKWETEGTPIQKRVATAILGTLRRLLRPVYVRDVAITIVGQPGRVPRPSVWHVKKEETL